jgi:polysaccharide export outer membrane protein
MNKLIYSLLLVLTCLLLCAGPAYEAQGATADGASQDLPASAVANTSTAPNTDNPVSVHVTVAGEVHAPGLRTVRADSSIVALLAAAGGVTEMGADTIYIERTDEIGRLKRYPIDLKDPRVPGAANWLREADRVVVPRAEQFSITGEVRKPDTYRLDAGMTVMQAIAKAGDVTIWGSYRHLVIQRKGADGADVTVKVKPDDLVEPGDVIRVKQDLF